MSNPLIMKLEHGADLTDSDRAILNAISRQHETTGAREDIIREDDRPDAVHLVMEGIACRYKLLPDGRRSIMAYLVPGDFCDLHVAILCRMDHSIATMTPCAIVQIPSETIADLTTNYPRITRALWWATLVDEAILREWLVSMGKRPADRQLAHLVCELHVRLKTVGRTDNGRFQLPITQDELADTLGISAVHVNRVLQQMREMGLISLQGRQLEIPDIDRLRTYAQFTPKYLHLMSEAT